MYEQQNNNLSPQESEILRKNIEKWRIQNTAWAVAIPGYFFFFVSFFLGALMVFLLARFGYSTDDMMRMLSDPVFSQVLEIGLSLILMTLPFIISAKIAGYNISKSGGFNKAKKGTVLPHLLFGVGFCAFANILVSAAGDFLKRFGIDYSAPKSEYPEGFFGFLLVFISTAVVPAVVEEFAFRGIVLGLLRPYGDAFAIIASSAVFSAMHGNFEQIPFTFLVALALGFIRVKSGSVIVCMAVHAANNFLAVLLSYASGLPAVARNLAYTVYVLLVLVAAVLGVILLKYKGEFSFPEQKRNISAGKTYLYFFLSPAIIIFFCLSLARAIIQTV